MTPADQQARKDAYAAVRRALRSGLLSRPTSCEDCGRTMPIHAHHYLGYAPEHRLDVAWICWDCHAWRHATGHRRGEAMPPDVRSAVSTLTAWMDRPSVEAMGETR